MPTSLQIFIPFFVGLSMFVYTTESSCCLRSTPISSLSDGLYLQNLLVSNHQRSNRDFWFLPNAPSLVLKKSQRDLVQLLLQAMKLKEALENLEETSIIISLKRIYNVIWSDACAYISDALDEQLDCSMESIEDLFNKLEISTIVQSLNRQIYDRKSPLFGTTGSSKNHYAYWNERVLQACADFSCPHIEDIEKKVIHFPLNSDICWCN